MIIQYLINETIIMDWNLTYIKKNGKDNYIKVVPVKRLLVILNWSYEYFSEVKLQPNGPLCHLWSHTCRYHKDIILSFSLLIYTECYIISMYTLWIDIVIIEWNSISISIHLVTNIYTDHSMCLDLLLPAFCQFLIYPVANERSDMVMCLMLFTQWSIIHT